MLVRRNEAWLPSIEKIYKIKQGDLIAVASTLYRALYVRMETCFATLVASLKE